MSRYKCLIMCLRIQQGLGVCNTNGVLFDCGWKVTRWVCYTVNIIYDLADEVAYYMNASGTREVEGKWLLNKGSSQWNCGPGEVKVDRESLDHIYEAYVHCVNVKVSLIPRR